MSPVSHAVFKLMEEAPPFAIAVFAGAEHVVSELGPSAPVAGLGPDAVGRPLTQARPELAGGELVELLARVYTTADPQRVEALALPVRGPDGRVVRHYAHANARPHRGPGGEVAGVMLFGVDVTAEVSAREQALESEQRLRALIELAPDAFFLSGPDGRYIDVNANACRLLGRTREEILGHAIADLLPPEDVPRLEEARRYMLTSKGRTHLGEWQLLRGDGTFVPVEVSAAILPDGRWQAFVRDIRERKRQERALRASESKFRRIFDSGMVGVLFADERGCVREANDQALRLLGYSRAQMEQGEARCKGLDLLGGDVLRLRDALRETGVCHPFEHEYERPDGRTAYFLVGCAQVAESDLAVAVLLDLSERRALEELLRDAVWARDEFLSLASHELRTPVTALALQLDALERLLRGGARTDSVEERMATSLASMHRQVERLVKLVGNIVDVTQLSLRRSKLEFAQVDLGALVQRAVAALSQEARRTGGEVVVSAQEGVRGRWDVTRLEQIVESLVANAIKYAPGTRVDVAVSWSGEEALLSVRDRGIGIAEGDLPRIFGRFERGVSSHHYGGLGLGLYVARELAEAHGGRIEVTSTRGEGAEFRVFLPPQGPSGARA